MRSAWMGWWMLVVLLLLAGVAGNAATVSEQVLPNGLKVLIKEVHAAPVVVVDMWYKVGSRNERPGLTGASHLLEHMTYKGTKAFGKDEMRALAKRNGAVDNGATFYDYTHYYTTIASDRLELPLRIEAGRMSSALIEQKELDAERVVVRSELEGRENSAGSLLYNEMMAVAFKAHPYHWPVIGWRSDVEQTTAAQLRDYYRTYYLPNNATLVIVGDVDTAMTMAMVRKHFGRIKRGPAPVQTVTPEPEQRGPRRVTVARQGSMAFMSIMWHVPSLTHADGPALMLLEQVLGTGRLSRLYQAVVEKEVGVGAWSSAMLQRDSGIFLVGGSAAQGKPVEPIEKVLLTEVERIKTDPPSKEELARALRQTEAALIFENDSVTQQADQLGEMETLTGDWRNLEALPARLRAVTPDDISRVARTYLTVNNSTTGIFQPTAKAGKENAASAGQVSAMPAGYRDAPAAATERIPAGMRRPDGQPAVTNTKVTRERFVLDNGLVLIVQENHANPTVAVHATLRAGKAYDPPGRKGLADFVVSLLDRGTTTRSATQIAEEMENAGAEINTATGWETAVLRGKALSQDSGLLLRNLADLVRHPAFPDDERRKLRSLTLASLAFERDMPKSSAYRNLYRALLPEGHPYRLPSFDEEEEGVKAITREDLVAFHQAHFTPDAMILTVVGDVDANAVRAAVARDFGDWTAPKYVPLAFPAVAPAPAAKIVTTIPDKSQVDIYLGTASTLTRKAPDYYAADVMNMILGGGGALNSRLGDVVRDRNGLAYGIYSTFHASTQAGPWYAVLGVNPANTDKAVALVKDEMIRMRDQGVTAKEVADAVAYLTGSQAIAMETNAAIAATLENAEYFGLGLDFPEKENSYYYAVTREQVNAAAKAYLHPDNLVVSISGPYQEK